MEFDTPILVTAFLYDLEKKLILFVGAVKVRLDSEQGVAEITATSGSGLTLLCDPAGRGRSSFP